MHVKLIPVTFLAVCAASPLRALPQQGPCEARTPIEALPATLTKSGSYYLTGDLQGVDGEDGITVLAASVSIDLNGFTLRGTPLAGHAIISAQDDLTVFGGNVETWRWAGIESLGTGTRVEGVCLEDAGWWGIQAGPETTVRRCFSTGNRVGIRVEEGSLVEGCIVSDYEADGIEARGGGGATRDSVAVGGGTGFADAHNTGRWAITGCSSVDNTGPAFTADGPTIFQWNLGAGSGSGLFLGSGSNQTQVHDNLFYGSDEGIRDAGADAVITRNVASLNTVNYDQGALTSDWGTIVGSTGVNGAWINLSH